MKKILASSMVIGLVAVAGIAAIDKTSHLRTN